MSTRTKRTTTTTTSATSSGHATPTTSKSPGRARPPSPTVLSRIQEKEELQSLNDRLAAYIDRVRHLETENSRLNLQVRSTEETVTREVSSIKALYENELGDARKLLDEMAKEKAKLQIEVGKYKADADEWMIKANKAQRELDKSEKKLLAAESQVTDLQARLNDAINQRKHWENEYNKLKAELAALEKQLATAKKQLEDETVARVDLENRLQSLKEELAFRTQVHEQELNETRTRTMTEVETSEVDGQDEQFRIRLEEALKRMREEYEFQIRTSREETEETFYNKLDELQRLAEAQDTSAMVSREELYRSRKRIDEINSELTRLQGVNAQLEKKVQDLEAELQREHDQHKAALDSRDNEIRKLRTALAEQMQEYRDLMDVKLSLDMELAAYRKLLEGEEARLNISQEVSMRSGTPSSSRKRKRGVESYVGSGAMSQVTQATSSSGYAASSSAKLAVEVSEIDTPDGKFIKLYNNSNKDQALGGWQLKHTSGDNETTYKFHRSVHLKGNAYVTVWSSDSGTTHNPPSDLVMKGQKWFVGDDMKTVLINTDGNEMASMSMKKSSTRTMFTGSRGIAGSSIEGDPDRKDQCAIM